MKKKHGCHNAKCSEELNDGNFIYMNYGGMEKVSDDGASMSNDIEALFIVGTHSLDPGPFGSVDLHSKVQYSYGGQGESYFCSKQCLFDWFQRKLKDLPEPGTTTWEEHSEN